MRVKPSVLTNTSTNLLPENRWSHRNPGWSSRVLFRHFMHWRYSSWEGHDQTGWLSMTLKVDIHTPSLGMTLWCMNTRWSLSGRRWTRYFWTMTKINLGCGWRNFGSDWVHIDGGDMSILITMISLTSPMKMLTWSMHRMWLISIGKRSYHPSELEKKNRWYFGLAVPNFANLCVYMRGNPIEKVLGPLYDRCPWRWDDLSQNHLWWTVSKNNACGWWVYRNSILGLAQCRSW